MNGALYEALQNTHTCVVNRSFAQTNDLEDRILALAADQLEPLDPIEQSPPLSSQILVTSDWIAFIEPGTTALHLSDDALISLYAFGHQ